ncbi:beta-microseminoprotein-like [Gigantopelta aegis]|uniref:beta-microseminoprotein-like n=1 Tax=Gigantopelta aegis TaxID=1735272 RepID=UPI001B88B511|nr:beta-microseminoprotein-like [Gigantopelta aegis]
MKLVLFTIVCMVQMLMINCYHNCGFKGPLQWRQTVTGQSEGYCMTDEIRPRAVQLGSDIKTKDCFNCQCTNSGLYCCGIGIKAVEDSISPPEGCQIFITGCDYYFRKLYDVNVPCY